ncbi:MAG: hypothetical protein FWC26_03285 [Fibromonadales bacterium]|nr:hypothetical protein [Fibromonadales bacterium]
MKRILFAALGAMMAIACSDDSSSGDIGDGGVCHNSYLKDGNPISTCAVRRDIVMTEAICTSNGGDPNAKYLKSCPSKWNIKCNTPEIEFYYYGSNLDINTLPGDCVKGN